MPSVIGCPEALALTHSVRAAREFCAHTLVWNYETSPIPSAAGVSRYTLQIDTGAELVRLFGVRVGDDDYDVPNGFTGRRLMREGMGSIAVMVGNQDFNLSPAPTLDGLDIVTDLSVKPTLDAVTWPDDLSAYVTDIAYGAIASLCVLPKQDWTDTATAAINAGLFKDRIGTVGFQVSKGMGRSKQRPYVEFF